jgi:hypothetical protein
MNKPSIDVENLHVDGDPAYNKFVDEDLASQYPLTGYIDDLQLLVELLQKQSRPQNRSESRRVHEALVRLQTTTQHLFTELKALNRVLPN